MIILTIESGVSVASYFEVRLVSGSGQVVSRRGSAAGGVRGGSRTSVVNMTLIDTEYLVSTLPVVKKMSQIT